MSYNVSHTCPLALAPSGHVPSHSFHFKNNFPIHGWRDWYIAQMPQSYNKWTLDNIKSAGYKAYRNHFWVWKTSTPLRKARWGCRSPLPPRFYSRSDCADVEASTRQGLPTLHPLAAPAVDTLVKGILQARVKSCVRHWLLVDLAAWISRQGQVCRLGPTVLTFQTHHASGPG